MQKPKQKDDKIKNKKLEEETLNLQHAREQSRNDKRRY